MYFDGDEELWKGIFVMLYKHISFNRGICGEAYDEYLPAFVPIEPNLTSRVYDYKGEEIKGYLSLETIQSLLKLLAASGAVYEGQLRKIIMQYVFFISIFYSQKYGAHINGDVRLEKKEAEMVKKFDQIKYVFDELPNSSLNASHIIDFLAHTANSL